MNIEKFSPDEGYYFGLGAFETIALYDGVPIFLDEHIKRMSNTLCFLDIKHDKDELYKLVEQDLSLPDAAAGAKALKIAVSGENQTVSIRENLYTQSKRQLGFKLKTSNVSRNQTSALTQHKTLNYADNILEKRLTTSQGYNEPIFCNTLGNVSEGATTNIFVVKNGRLLTPPATDGLLPGIMRAFVLENNDVDVRSISLDDALCADEIFVTNSLMGIMPVTSWDSKTFDNHAIAHKIQAKYEEVCAGVC